MATCSNVESVPSQSNNPDPYIDIDVATDKDSSCLADSHNVTVTLQTNSLSDIEESDCPWIQPSITSLSTEATIRKNLTEHRKAVLDSLNPNKLFGLFEQFDLDEILNDKERTREDKANKLLHTIHQENAHTAFLSSLEEDREHMGHWYIISLLRGKEFAGEEDIEESRLLKEHMSKEMNLVLQYINTDTLLPHLTAKDLITNEEQGEMTSPHATSRQKARKLHSLLNTKGPVAHLIFVHECLAAEENHRGHRDLYEQLTAPRGPKKRKTTISMSDTPPTKKRKYDPVILTTPKGLATTSYIQVISTIRQHQHTGRDGWKIAEDICAREKDSPDNAVEVRVAMVLESTLRFSLNRETEEVLSRVEEARKMIAEVQDRDFNEQLLDARCECVLARLYLHMGDINTATTHINKAFNLLSPCEYGEEHIIANYIRGCLILEDDISSASWPKVKESLESAESLALDRDYGLNIAQYCKTKLALARIGSSISNPRRNRVGVAGEHIDAAKQLLREVKRQTLPARIECLYLCTMCDVYRMDNDIKLATKCIEDAHKLTEKCDTKYETEMVRIRQQLLKKEIVPKRSS